MTTSVVQNNEVLFTCQNFCRYLYSFKRSFLFVLMVILMLNTVRLMLPAEGNREIPILSKSSDPTNLTRPGYFPKPARHFPDLLQDAWKNSAKHNDLDQEDDFSSMVDPEQNSTEVKKHFIDLIKNRFAELKGSTQDYKLKSDEVFSNNMKISDDPDVFANNIDTRLKTQKKETTKQSTDKFAKSERVTPKTNYSKEVPMELTKNWNESTTKEVREVMKQRSAVVENVCHHYAASNNFTELNLDRLYGHLRWVNQYNFVWCPLFKCASTTWTKNLVSLADYNDPPYNYHQLSHRLYPPPKEETMRRTLLQTTKKLLIVRHPLDRLLSAYRDKILITRPAGNGRNLQRNISATYLEPFVPAHIDLSAIKPPAPHQPSFNKFLLRVKDDIMNYWQDSRSPINYHWRPYWATCSPCSLRYDIIAKVETLQRDQEFVVRDRDLPVEKLFAKTHSSMNDNFNSSAAATTAYFSRVPRSLLTEIVKLYQPDFDLFEYSPEFYLQLSVPDV